MCNMSYICTYMLHAEPSKQLAPCQDPRTLAPKLGMYIDAPCRAKTHNESSHLVSRHGTIDSYKGTSFSHGVR